MNKPWDSKDFPDTEPASTLPLMAPGEEQLFAETQPQALIDLANVRAANLDTVEPEPGGITLYDAIVEIRRDGRVCPLPARWLEFYRVLEQCGSAAPLPAPPLLGPAWIDTPSSAKRMCFSEQVEWAARNGCLQPAYRVLQALAPSEWQYA